MRQPFFNAFFLNTRAWLWPESKRLWSQVSSEPLHAELAAAHVSAPEAFVLLTNQQFFLVFHLSCLVLPPLFSLFSRTTVLQLFSVLGGRRLHRGTCLHTEPSVSRSRGWVCVCVQVSPAAATLTVSPARRYKPSPSRCWKEPLWWWRCSSAHRSPDEPKHQLTSIKIHLFNFYQQKGLWALTWQRSPTENCIPAAME